MALIIRKKSNFTFEHYFNGATVPYITNVFNINNGGNETFQLVDYRGANLQAVPINQIILYDDTTGGGAETFTTFAQLNTRLGELNYPPMRGENAIPSDFNLRVQEGEETPIQNVNKIIFSGATVTDNSDGSVTVTITGGGGSQNLQEVTDEGAITTNPITVTDGAGTETTIEPIGVTILSDDNLINLNSGGLLIQNPNNETHYSPEGIAIGDLNTNESIWLTINGLEKYIGSGLITSVEFETPTGERTITFKDESGTVALTSDIPPTITIDATPTDGSSNAVSSNGVFDALALKADLNRTEQYIISKGVGNYGSVTGTVAETVILSIPFLGGDFEIGDYLGFNIWTTKVGTAGTTNIALRAGTTGTTADSVLSILQSHTTGQLSVASLRQGILFETGNFINGRTRPTVNAVSIDVGSFVNYARFSLNPSNNWFLTFTVQHAVSTDVINVSSYQVTKTKTF